MNKILKIFKVFLKLKIQEIWGGIKEIWEFIALFVGFVVLCGIIAFGMFSVNVWVCFVSIYLFTTCIVAGNILAVILIVVLVCKIVFSFCSWIKQNWIKARKIVNEQG